MNNYIGVKEIGAMPMNRGEYNQYRGWQTPEGENEEDEGYLVEYVEGGKPNHENHAGYISWSPKAVFENAYRATSGMNFGLAIEAAKIGYKIARAGWNGKNMYLFIESGAYPSGPYGAEHYEPAIVMFTAQQKYQIGWLASQADILADDWMIVE